MELWHQAILMLQLRWNLFHNTGTVFMIKALMNSFWICFRTHSGWWKRILPPSQVLASVIWKLIIVERLNCCICLNMRNLRIWSYRSYLSVLINSQVNVIKITPSLFLLLDLYHQFLSFACPWMHGLSQIAYLTPHLFHQESLVLWAVWCIPGKC